MSHISGSNSYIILQSDKDENLIAFYKRSHLQKLDKKLINGVGITNICEYKLDLASLSNNLSLSA